MQIGIMLNAVMECHAGSYSQLYVPDMRGRHLFFECNCASCTECMHKLQNAWQPAAYRWRGSCHMACLGPFLCVLLTSTAFVLTKDSLQKAAVAL